MAALGFHCCAWFLTAVASPVAEHGLYAAPRHVESSRSRNRTCVLCTSRWILNHWATREVPLVSLLFFNIKLRLVFKKCFLTSFYSKTLLESESEVAQSCPTLCDPMDCSISGSSVYAIFQARMLEWIAISFSRRSSRPRKRTQISRIAGSFTI